VVVILGLIHGGQVAGVVVLASRVLSCLVEVLHVFECWLSKQGEDEKYLHGSRSRFSERRVEGDVEN
jgi:hypothetical protein